jgi:hypothetical protein
MLSLHVEDIDKKMAIKIINKQDEEGPSNDLENCEKKYIPISDCIISEIEVHWRLD